MLQDKRGAIFSLMMVFFTLFLCGVVILLYFTQQSNVQSSLVSPSNVLDVRDNLTIFEIREVELIKKNFDGDAENFGKDDFKKSFRDNFIDGVMADSDMTEFLFSRLFIGEKEMKGQVEDRNLLENAIYPENLTSFDGDKMNFGRSKIEKRGLMVAKNKSKIDFPVYFTFEFERKYLISKDGEVVKL